MPTNLASGAEYDTVGQKRWVWPGFALPGVIWLTLLFLVPFYAVFAIAMGQLDPVLQRATPEWNPFYWDLTVLGEAFAELFGGQLGVIALRTLAYVLIACVLSVAIGYPVAYFVSRKAGRWRWLWLLLILAPFWINYLMRMMSWVNLLSPDGQVNRWLTTIAAGSPSTSCHPIGWPATIWWSSSGLSTGTSPSSSSPSSPHSIGSMKPLWRPPVTWGPAMHRLSGG